MSKLRPLIFIIFLTIPFLTTSLKLDDKMYLLQQEENNLISSHQSNAMSSISLQSTQLHNAEFKLGCQNNFYSFLLRGKYADFVLSNADHPIFSVTQDKNIMFFPSTLTTSQGLNYFGNFKVKGTTQWNLIAEENPKDGVSGWSNNTISHCNGVYMLGGYCKYGNGETVKEYMHLPKHSQIKIEATYHFIDAWDGESGYMKVNNGKNNEMEYVWIEKYSAFLGENGINVCGGRWPEGKFASPISVVIPHKADSLMLAFGATIEQDPCDESFGISGIRIYIR
jgi:hypothetical protein